MNSTESRAQRAARLIRTAERRIDAALDGTAPRGDLDARLAIRDASEATRFLFDEQGHALAHRLNAAVRRLNLARR